MKDVQDMTMKELIDESLTVNKRIAKDKRQSWRERQRAQQKCIDMEYLKKIRELYS